MGRNLPVTFSTTVVPSIDQLVTSPKMLPGKPGASPWWSTQPKCPVAEPSDRSLTPIANELLPAAIGGCISAVPAPLIVATTVAGPRCGARMPAAGKIPGSFLGPVISEQAVMTVEVLIAVALVSLRGWDVTPRAPRNA